MSINVKESTMICPAKEPPRRSLWLSKLDMMIRQPYSHTHILFIFHANADESDNNTPFFDTKIMKEALSKTLVAFYPIAGRLNMNEKKDRYEIDCNDEGALFIEAETTRTLADFGADCMPNAELQKMLIPPCDYSKGISSFPLLLVQLTRFKCGGVCLGFAQHHHVADGTSHLHFINSWARIARGLDLDVMPCHERETYLAPRDPPQVKFQHLEYEPSFAPVLPKSFSGEVAKTTDCSFKLTKEHIMNLKTQVMSEKVLDYKPSTFELLAGIVWRSTCKARGLADDQDVKIYIHTNGRSRLKNPTLPQGYCGNVIFFAACIAKAGDLIANPIWYTTNKIHEAVKRMENVEYLRSAIDYVESQQDLTTLVRGAHSVTCPNLQINSWARMPFYEVNFGWGIPVFAGLSGIKCEGQSKIISSPNADGSYTVAIKLFTSHMALFKKYLYDF